MADTTPSQQRMSLITTKRAEAARLLERANHPTMKELVRRAIAEVDEAATWLEQPSIDSRPSLMSIVDLLLQLSTGRLNVVNNAINIFGPDATLMGS